MGLEMGLCIFCRRQGSPRYDLEATSAAVATKCQRGVGKGPLPQD